MDGGPAWLDSERFNVSAGLDGDHPLDSDGVPRQTLSMLRTLLAEQFKLKMRTEVREMPVYAPGPFDPGYGPSDVARAMFTALPAELGLRLEATTAPVEVLVIEDAASPNKPDPLPLVVESAEIVLGDAADRTSDQILITIRNGGGKTIVAWGVRANLTFADRKPFSTATSTDGVESRDLVRRDSTVLPPGGRHTFRLASFSGDRAVRDVLSVTATATLVIFDDDTALGDERTIRFHFEKRAANKHAWPAIEKERRLRSGRGGPAGLHPLSESTRVSSGVDLLPSTLGVLLL